MRDKCCDIYNFVTILLKKVCRCYFFKNKLLIYFEILIQLFILLKNNDFFFLVNV